VNINTLFPDSFDSGQPVSTVFRALCDAQPGGPNHFRQQDVDAMYRRLYASRTPGAIPGAGDRPFQPFTAGVVSSRDRQYPDGSGIESTIFRTVGGQRLFEFTPADGADHPYVRQSLLNKIYANMSLRSNVFAVWVTVGFFEVNDQGLLGTEIGRSEGHHRRHRMFAIVDRSAFAKSPGATGTTLSTLLRPVMPSPNGGEVQVFPASMTDIHQGSQVTITNQGAQDQVRVVGVQLPNMIVANGSQHDYGPGATLTFTANVPQLQNGETVNAPQTFTATVTSSITNGQSTFAVNDPSVLPYIKPGGQQATISNASYSETTTVSRVYPTNGPPNSFFCTLHRVYNVGDQTAVGYFAPTPDVIDPTSVGPQKVWNTRDNHGYNDPVVFYSVID
jgi:hypothetical protein